MVIMFPRQVLDDAVSLEAYNVMAINFNSWYVPMILTLEYVISGTLEPPIVWFYSDAPLNTLGVSMLGHTKVKNLIQSFNINGLEESYLAQAIDMLEPLLRPYKPHLHMVSSCVQTPVSFNFGV